MPKVLFDSVHDEEFAAQLTFLSQVTNAFV